MDDRRNDYSYGNTGLTPYARNAPMRQPHSFGPDAVLKDAQVLTQGGFKPLSKEEREEAAQIALEAGFSFEGYQVVRREHQSFDRSAQNGVGILRDRHDGQHYEGDGRVRGHPGRA